MDYEKDKKCVGQRVGPGMSYVVQLPPEQVLVFVLTPWLGFVPLRIE